ncbi:MAG: FemAB family PEP-CTERM system-associated protein [Marinicaulis sp.]|nr:FemAB family PEP-CTERM system-associated protein [Marinicaulis sp.]
MAVEIKTCGPGDAALWDDYVLRAPSGTIFHRFGWRNIIASVYGYDAIQLMALQDNIPVGVLPLFDIRSPLLGRSLIATAFTVGGGVLSENVDACEALCREAEKIGCRRRVKYVEIRSEAAGAAGWIPKTERYASFELSLIGDADDALKAVPRKRRAEVRKALEFQKNGRLSIRFDGSVDEFYELYAVAMRNHGTPVFPKKYVAALVTEWPEDVEISIVESDGAAIVALLTFYDGINARPYFIGARQNTRGLRAQEFAYWMTMRRAAERGCTNFDFGRSKIDTGPYKFKKLWGCEPNTLTYQYKLLVANTLPDVNPNNPKFELFSNTWKKLPMPIANFVGPFLAPNFP